MRRIFILLVLASLAPALFAGQAAKPRHQLIDHGPFVSYTIAPDWPRLNIAYKGIAIRLKSGNEDKGGVLFDTDLMRISAAWTGGFVKWERDVATARDYRAVVPEGLQIAGTMLAPGTGETSQFSGTSFKDPRAEPFGPLPKDWARYRGLYVNGDSVALSYSIGDTAVLESPAFETSNGVDAVVRTLNISATTKPLTLVLTQRDGSSIELARNGAAAILRRAEPAAINGNQVVVSIDRVEDNWERLQMAAPGKNDFLSRNKTLSLEAVDGKVTGKTSLLSDGEGAKMDIDPERCVWFEGGGRFVADLKNAIDVRQIDSYSWHKNECAPQLYQLYGSAADAPNATAADPAAAGWTLIAKVDTRSLGEGGMHGASLTLPGRNLGKFRHLLFVTEPPKAGSKEGTYFCEIDVYSADDTPKLVDYRLAKTESNAVALAGNAEGATLRAADRGTVVLDLKPSATPRKLKIIHWAGVVDQAEKFVAASANWTPAADLQPLTTGGKRHWTETLDTKGKRNAKDDAPYVVDDIVLPESNPWNVWFRPAAFDFFADNTSAAMSNWSGDVWVVKGITDSLEKLSWQRVASGFFHPLGLKIVDGKVYVLGRDQITRLHDLNGDGEMDFYENFNSDCAVTWNFHEFAFDLQTDAEGNFYFAKGGPVRNGGRGFERIAEHHGSILKVCKDGSKVDRVATGLRAPNGMAIAPTGEISTGENEGTWVPACKINWLKPGQFAGVVPTAHRNQKPTTYDPPLCWLPREVDNSGGGQVWVTSDRWGPFKGEMLHLSYGTCWLFKVLKENVDGITQGGVVKFPLGFDSGIMRARFNAADGQLYVCGLKGWQTTASKDGCFQRVRYTGKPVTMPTTLEIYKDQVRIGFTGPLDKAEAVVADNYSVEQWNYLWSEAYGSADYSVADPSQKKRDPVAIQSVTVSPDGKFVTLNIPGVKPVMQMKIKFKLKSESGATVNHEIHNTINTVRATAAPK